MWEALVVSAVSTDIYPNIHNKKNIKIKIVRNKKDEYK